MNNKKLKPCPWCASRPVAEPWHGGGPGKTRIGCVNDDCPATPSVAAETPGKAAKLWNTRYAEKAP